MHPRLLQRRRPAAQDLRSSGESRPVAPRQVVDGGGDSFSLTGPLTITVIKTDAASPTPSSTSQANPTTTLPSPAELASTGPSPSPLPSSDGQTLSPSATPTTTPTPLSSSSATSTAASSSSKATQSFHLPAGTIAAVVVVSVVGLLGLLVFLVRKRYINNRKRKTFTWGEGIMKPISSADMMMFNSNTPPVITTSTGTESSRFSPMRSYNTGEVSPGTDTRIQAIPSPISPPPTSYNNPMPPLTPGMPSPGLAASFQNPPNAAVVQCTFIPTLPDELSISTGESVTVLSEYDDGWALCANSKGERGMVPLECLDRGERGLRNSRRTSSLLGSSTRY